VPASKLVPITQLANLNNTVPRDSHSSLNTTIHFIMTATVSPTVVKSTPPSTTSTTMAPPASLLTDQAQDIPIFLRKTYHMIDTCDPAIACWAEDGETFVVKDPVKFEKQIIPQFFKHSKFSSFVRQLNFYAFRKIKYADTIRIDPKLEAETANYWRFRHEKFQRGKPELLGEIKRMNGQKQQQKKDTSAVPAASAAAEKENSALKSEVSNLKQRIEAMTKNIDDLTSLVQKVTLATQTPPPVEKVNSNNKRAKVEDSPIPDAPVSTAPLVAATPEHSSFESSSSDAMEVDAFALPPSIPSPMPVMDRPATSGSELSDEGFVDQLFTAFKTEDFDFDESETLPTNANSNTAVKTEEIEKEPNRPRPELMNKLSDALSVLPRDIQELIVDRLIQAITSPKEIQDNISAANALKQVDKKDVNQKNTVTSASSILPVAPTKDPKQIANLQLAAATLAALLSQCGGENKQPKDAHSGNKTLLIPVHA